MRCGYRHRRTPISSGYNCAIASWRVTSTWLSRDWEDDWKIPVLTQDIPTKTTGRGNRAGRNTASGSPSAQEMKDGPDKNKADERRDN
jgi:hypothetical protein